MTFIRNEYGLWCPNCQERIDEMWPVSCDACGYPSPDCEDFDAEREDYFEGPDDPETPAFLSTPSVTQPSGGAE